jgi:hypothetical protein
MSHPTDFKKQFIIDGAISFNMTQLIIKQFNGHRTGTNKVVGINIRIFMAICMRTLVFN